METRSKHFKILNKLGFEKCRVYSLLRKPNVAVQ